MKDEIIFSPFYSSFLRLCQEKGVSPSKAAEEAGISSGAPTAWKRGAVPKPIQRKKLCDYFEVTDNVLLGYEQVSDLTGEKEKSPAPEGAELTDTQKEAVQFVLGLSEKNLKMFIKMGEAAFGEEDEF